MEAQGSTSKNEGLAKVLRVLGDTNRLGIVVSIGKNTLNRKK